MMRRLPGSSTGKAAALHVIIRLLRRMFCRCEDATRFQSVRSSKRVIQRRAPSLRMRRRRELGVTMSTIHRWLREGILAGNQMVPGAPWRILLTDEVRRKLSGGDAPEGWVGVSEAARRLGLSKPYVVYLIKTGRL